MLSPFSSFFVVVIIQVRVVDIIAIVSVIVGDGGSIVVDVIVVISLVDAASVAATVLQ